MFPHDMGLATLVTTVVYLLSLIPGYNSLNTSLVVYWGQNSYGAANPSNPAKWQQPIEYYCSDDAIDKLSIAFLIEFHSIGGLPTINLANSCSAVNAPPFPGTTLLNCTFLAAGIEACQKAGKIVTLSIGGADGGGVEFTNDSDGQAYAQVVWDTFLGGSSNTRPFGTAVLDGIDMNIEGGMQTGYTAFLTSLRTLMDGKDRVYYITAAPQCPFPDAYIGTTLNAFGFDAVYVQFYNNYCEVSNYYSANDWNFGTWDSWARTISPNKNIKVHIGVPASPTAATAGYVSASMLAMVISETMGQYSSFGGVMLWDVSQAYANSRYDKAVKAALDGLGGVLAPSSSGQASRSASWETSTISTNSTTSTKVTTTRLLPPPTTAGTGLCAGVSPWKPSIIYLGGDNATYDSQLWTAAWWTEGTAPGGSEGVWALDGSC